MIIKEEQNTMDWLIKRRSRIGATDFAMLYEDIVFPNKNKKSAIEKLIKEKIEGKSDYSGEYATNGHEREEAIIARISAYTGLDFEIDLTSLCDENYSLSSSLDAYNRAKKSSVEAKTMTITSKNFWDNFEKNLQKWIGQIIHQKYCEDLQRIYLGLEFQHYNATDMNFECDRKDFIAIDCNSGEIIIEDMPHTPLHRCHIIKEFLKRYLTISNYDITKEKWLKINNEALSALDDARSKTEL